MNSLTIQYIPVFSKPHRAPGLPPCPYAYPRNSELSLRRHEMSVKHASPVPSGPGSAEGTAFTGARTQQKSSRQPSFVSLTSISTCFPFPGWLGVCSLSLGDFLKFFRLQQFSRFQDLLSRPRSASKSITNQTQVGGSFST